MSVPKQELVVPNPKLHVVMHSIMKSDELVYCSWVFFMMSGELVHYSIKLFFNQAKYSKWLYNFYFFLKILIIVLYFTQIVLPHVLAFIFCCSFTQYYDYFDLFSQITDFFVVPFIKTQIDSIVIFIYLNRFLSWEYNVIPVLLLYILFYFCFLFCFLNNFWNRLKLLFIF